MASVELAPARSPRLRRDDPLDGQLIVQVLKSTADRAPLASAIVALLVGTNGADSGKFVTRRFTSDSGLADFDSLAPRRYEVVVYRLGYDALRERVTVRPNYTDTMRIILHGHRLCLHDVTVGAI